MDSISDLFKARKYMEISQKFSCSEVTENLSFEDGMRLSNQLLLNDAMDDNLREYAVDLLESNRKAFPRKWEDDWRNEIFLGDAYYLMLKFDEQFECYNRIAKKISSYPPALLISLASCYADSSNTLDKAEKLVLEALEKEKSIEGATLIRGIYKTKGNTDQFIYWDGILQELEKKNAYMKDKWPKYLKSE